MDQTTQLTNQSSYSVPIICAKKICMQSYSERVFESMIAKRMDWNKSRRIDHETEVELKMSHFMQDIDVRRTIFESGICVYSALRRSRLLVKRPSNTCGRVFVDGDKEFEICSRFEKNVFRIAILVYLRLTVLLNTTYYQKVNKSSQLRMQHMVQEAKTSRD